MLKIALVLTVGFLPCVISLVAFHQQQQRAGKRLQQAIAAAHRRQLQQLLPASTLESPLGVQHLLGNPACRFSAHSAYLRCAVNPAGDCGSCRYFETVR